MTFAFMQNGDFIHGYIHLGKYMDTATNGQCCQYFRRRCHDSWKQAGIRVNVLMTVCVSQIFMQKKLTDDVNRVVW